MAQLLQSILIYLGALFLIGAVFGAVVAWRLHRNSNYIEENETE